MNLSTALYQLRTHPETFLRSNLLNLAGSAQPAPRLNYFGRYDGIAPGVNEGFSIKSYRSTTIAQKWTG